MDEMLCDELLQEIFARLPPSPPSRSSPLSRSSPPWRSSLSVSLVSKRWLALYRASRTSLSLRLEPLDDSTIPFLSSLLLRYPSLSSLSLLLSSFDHSLTSNPSFSDKVLFLVSSSCPNLRDLRVLIGAVSRSSLFLLSSSCVGLTSLTLSVARPVSFEWVAWFSSLKHLSVSVSSINDSDDEFDYGRRSQSSSSLKLSSVSVSWRNDSDDEFDSGRRSQWPSLGDDSGAELGLDSLALSGIRADDLGFGWLWRSCKKLRKLKLKTCGSLGDGASFALCLNSLEEVELRTCRSIVDGVLLKLAKNCSSLHSLLVYDGGSREGLLHFIANSRCDLRNLDLRLPLDLNDDHLSRVSTKFRRLSNLRLQSCCLVTGEGLKTLASALGSNLEKLALINCDAVEREPGLLASLGQLLKRLRTLDLSYNEFLSDKEFASMLVSCSSLHELKLRGCRALTGASIASIIKSCKELKTVDVLGCYGIEPQAVESFVMNSSSLRRIQVEECKLSGAAKAWASSRFMEALS